MFNQRRKRKELDILVKKEWKDEEEKMKENEEPMEVDSVKKPVDSRLATTEEVEKRYRKHQTDTLMAPFLNYEEEKRVKIHDIMDAIKKNSTELLTFDFMHFCINLPGAKGAHAKVQMILFDDECSEDDDVWEGDLSMSKEINKNVTVKYVRNVGDFHSAYLIAEVGVMFASTSRRDTISAFSETRMFYGVKNLKQGSSEEFVFNCGNTGIYLATKDDPCLKALSFDVTDVNTWKKAHLMVKELVHRTKPLPVRDAPFIAYEMKDLHADEDWDAVRERYKLRQYYTAQNGARMTNYVAYDGSNIATKVIEKVAFGRCPITFTKYTEAQDYVEFLNKTYKDLKFHDLSNGCCKIGVELVKDEDVGRPPENIPEYKPETWEGGIIPKEYFPFVIEEEEVPIRTGKNKANTWVKAVTGRDWKSEETERRIMNLETLPDECKPFSILLNKFIMKDEFAFCAHNEMRRQMFTKFFTEKCDELVEMGAVAWACLYMEDLLQRAVFTPQDYATLFDALTTGMLKKEEEDNKKKKTAEQRLREDEAGPSSCSMN